VVERPTRHFLNPIIRAADRFGRAGPSGWGSGHCHTSCPSAQRDDRPSLPRAGAGGHDERDAPPRSLALGAMSVRMLSGATHAGPAGGCTTTRSGSSHVARSRFSGCVCLGHPPGVDSGARTRGGSAGGMGKGCRGLPLCHSGLAEWRPCAPTVCRGGARGAYSAEHCAGAVDASAGIGARFWGRRCWVELNHLRGWGS
jgi:hypothetical protein